MNKLKRRADKTPQIIIKCLMTAVFLWSGFFWSGVTILQFFINNTEHRNLAIEFSVSSALLLICLILCWLRFYILQFIPGMIGFIAFLNPVKEMMDHVASTGVIFKPTFEQRYLPMIAFAIFSLALLLIRILGIISEKAKREEEYNNRPTESIFDKHSEE